MQTKEEKRYKITAEGGKALRNWGKKIYKTLSMTKKEFAEKNSE